MTATCAGLCRSAALAVVAALPSRSARGGRPERGAGPPRRGGAGACTTGISHLAQAPDAEHLDLCFELGLRPMAAACGEHPGRGDPRVIEAPGVALILP